MAPTKPARLSYDDAPIVPPPATMTVEYSPKPVLHLPNGKVLVRRPGF